MLSGLSPGRDTPWARIVNDAVPLPLAVPEIAPVELSSEAHDGSEPAVTLYVNPAQAPVAVAPE